MPLTPSTDRDRPTASTPAGVGLRLGQCPCGALVCHACKALVAPAEASVHLCRQGGVDVDSATSALMAKPLADLLLKLVKPTVKKIMKKIASLRGQSQKVESVSQRQLAQRDRNRAIRALRVALKK